MWPAALLQLGSVALDPAEDRRVIDMQSPFPHHLFQITIAERIPQIPADAQQNDLRLKMTPFERTWVAHNGTPLVFSKQSRVYQSIGMFATEPLKELEAGEGYPPDRRRHEKTGGDRRD